MKESEKGRIEMASSKMGRNPFGQKKNRTEAPKVSKEKNDERAEALEPRAAPIGSGQAVQALIGTALDQVSVSIPIGLASVATEAGKRMLSLVTRR